MAIATIAGTIAPLQPLSVQAQAGFISSPSQDPVQEPAFVSRPRRTADLVPERSQPFQLSDIRGSGDVPEWVTAGIAALSGSGHEHCQMHRVWAFTVCDSSRDRDYDSRGIRD